MHEDPRDDRPRLEIDWLKTAAGALAAVSSAVILSSLGAAGTIIGAAVGSIVVSVTGSLYNTGLNRSRERVARAHATAMQRVGVAQAEVRRAARRRGSSAAVEGHLEHADRELGEARAELDDLSTEEPRPPLRERLAGLPWKRIVLVALGLFVVAVVAITIFELIAGRPVSDFTGGTHGRTGTSVTDLGGGGKPDRPTPTPAPGRQPSETPSQVPTFQTTPTQAPSPGESASSTPTPSPSSSAPGTPTGTPTPSPSPSPTASPTAGAS